MDCGTGNGAENETEREHLTRNLFKRQLARNKFPKRIVTTAWRTDGYMDGDGNVETMSGLGRQEECQLCP